MRKNKFVSFMSRIKILLIPLCLILIVVSLWDGTLSYVFTQTPSIINTFISGVTPEPSPSPTPSVSPTPTPSVSPSPSPTPSQKPDDPSLPEEPEIPDVPLISANHYNYIIGMPDGNVYPEANISRAEVVTIFFRLLTDNAREQYWSTENRYPDVQEEDWYYIAVCTMTNVGVVEGYPNGNFGPNDPITRGELATIITRFDAKYGEIEATKTFPDINGHWAEDYISFAATRGYILGYLDGTFKPDNLITRSETVAMVNRLTERGVDEEGLMEGHLEWPDLAEDNWAYYHMLEATNHHDYDRSERQISEQDYCYENWTEILAPHDWARLEKEWENIYTGH